MTRSEGLHADTIDSPAAAPSIRLSVRGATKDYSVRVLDGVDLDLHEGEIHALVGSNGAGKSTLCKIIAGLIPATRATMSLDGAPFAPPHKQMAESRGVQIVQQELNLIPTLTVAENLMFGRLPQRFGVIHRQRLRRDAITALDRFGMKGIDPDRPASTLGVGKQQMLEIASALDRDCRVLILDEPTAALSPAETESLFRQLEGLRDAGVSIIYISHRLDEVMRLSGRVTVLRDGKRVITVDTADTDPDRLISVMTGEQRSAEVRDHQTHRTEKVRLRVRGLQREGVLHGIDLDLHEGERLGISGLVGSGRTELLRCIFGGDVATAGSVYVDQDKTAHRFNQPRAAIRNGLAMVTEDRKQNGLLLPRSIRDNVTLCRLQRFASAGILRPKRETHAAEAMRARLKIRSDSVSQSVGTLSGGNQQKVAVAKWLVRDSEIYLFDEPTRGIDIAARHEIYELMESMARDGKSLLIVSSDVDELMEICDRVLVMSAGRIVRSLGRDHWSRDLLTQASFAGYRTKADGTSEGQT